MTANLEEGGARSDDNHNVKGGARSDDKDYDEGGARSDDNDDDDDHVVQRP
jgi:hypothetical protein